MATDTSPSPTDGLKTSDLHRVVLYGSFHEVASLDAPPSCAFVAFSDRALGQRWFRLPSSRARVRTNWTFGSGVTRLPPARSGPLMVRCNIAPDECTVCAYEQLVDGVRRSVSLATVELGPEDDGTLDLSRRSGSRSFHPARYPSATSARAKDELGGTRRRASLSY